MSTSFNSHIAKRSPEWYQWLSEGKIGLVIDEINELPSPFESEKPFLRSQIYHKAGMHAKVLEEVQNLAIGNHVSPISLTKLATIVDVAGNSARALVFLTAAVDLANSCEELELTLEAAESLGNRDIEQRIVEELSRNCAESRVLKRFRIREFISNGEYFSAADLCSRDPDIQEDSDLYTIIGNALAEDSVPDYLATIAAVTDKRAAWAERVKTICVHDGLNRKLLKHALNLLLGLSRL